MLQLVLGTSGHGKTEYLINKIETRLKEKDDFVYIIVPDQLSFSLEKSFLNRFGAKLASKIKVWSFTRFSEEVFRIYGGIKEKPLSETGKYAVLSKAIKIAKDNLKVYHKASDTLLKLMLEAIVEFKENLISPSDLFEKSKEMTGNLKDKINDIALIYEIYNALIKDKYLDESDVLTRACDILEDKDFLEGSYVFFDGFESFNRQKLKIIAYAMKKAEICYVSLASDSAALNEESVFEPISRTVLNIKRIAAEENVKENVPVFFKDAVRFENDELKHLEKYLFRTDIEPYNKEVNNIEIFEALNVYDEIEYIAAKIRNLVIDENYRYGDFSIVCKDPGKYYSILSPTFEKWNIPCYYQEPVKLNSRPIIRLIEASYRIVKYGFRTEDILSLLKTGLTEFNSDDISMLENYLYLWKIEGKAWKSDFFKHPKGFGYDLLEEDAEKLLKLNEIRRTIILPLIRFGDKYSEGKASDIGAGIYELLLNLKVDKNISETFNEYIKLGMPDLAKDGSLSWQKLMDILDEFANSFGDEVISLQEYFSVFKDVVAKAESRDIPMRMDTVTFTSIDVYKPQEVKVCFVLGAVQGELPFIPSDNGLFTDNERNKLISCELNMESRLEDRIKSERFLTYAAAVSSCQKLIVTYHLFLGEEDTVPGRLVSEIKKIFPLLKVKKEEKLNFYTTTYNSLFAFYASMYKKDSSERESLKKLLIENPDYKKKTESLDLISRNKAFEIKDKYLSERMFSDTYFSASQVESYHKCAFSYFCKYGLNVKEKRTAEIDNLEYGTIMHYLFEAILKSDYNVYIENREKLLDDVNELIEKYKLTKMGGSDTLSGKDKYRFSRLSKAAVSMIERFIEELSISKFEPKYFELYLSDYSDFPPLRIKTERNKYITVGGIADRVDVYETEKGKYVRIIDYKTGTKEFKYSDVLFGLNLQMLIYLAAMSEKGKVIPSGILYLPSSVPEISGEKNINEEIIKKEKDKKLASSGVVLDNAEIINAMEMGAAGRFLPTGIKDNGNYTKPQSVINEQGFEILFEHTKNLIKTMADNLIGGDIPASPLMVNNNSCAYCPYGSVCGNMKDERSVNKLKLTKEDVLKEIEKQMGKGENDAEMD